MIRKIARKLDFDKPKKCKRYRDSNLGRLHIFCQFLNETILYKHTQTIYGKKCMNTKYIFVTGGVVSGIGKGITAATIGLILKSNGYSVDVIKFDPYLNIDPGTMSPFEHGEVYVLNDGSETDLDLGHYERFLETDLTGISSVTAGKIYHNILEKERVGEYLGKNVQLIPNVTNYIKECFESESKSDIRIIEIGGSTGDMEGEIFLESFRQFKLKNKESVFHVHLGYIPFLACSGEYKSKPMQSSLRELLQSGLQPDMVVLRSEATDTRPLPQSIIEKIALFSNLESKSVISFPDMNSIYEVPAYALEKTSILSPLSDFLQNQLTPKLPEFYEKYPQVLATGNSIKIGLITKYTNLADAYLSVYESCKIAGIGAGVNVKVEMIDSDSDDIEKKIDLMDAIIVPGGFGKRGMEGKIRAITHVRTTKKPFLGICLGLQMAVVEFARNKAGLSVYSREMFEENEKLEGRECIIDFMEGQENIKKKGGSMRLGDYECRIKSGSLAHNLYKSTKVLERHRHRLEVQNQYISELEKHGMNVSGSFELPGENSDFLVEIVELDQNLHPFFIAIQSHPEFLSRPSRPHPLFFGLIQAVLAKKNPPSK
jgi:CTP synthase